MILPGDDPLTPMHPAINPGRAADGRILAHVPGSFKTLYMIVDNDPGRALPKMVSRATFRLWSTLGFAHSFSAR